MRFLEEVFLESDFDNRQTARQERDQRLAELQAQGYECRVEDLYTVHTGIQVLVIVALPPTEIPSPVNPKEQPESIEGNPTHGQRPHPKVKSKTRSPQSEKLQDKEHRRSRTDLHPR